jgi:hypothetical protein
MDPNESWWSASFTYQIHRDYAHAIVLDNKNGNMTWQDCTNLEMEQLREYQAFQDKGHSRNTKPPDRHKKIRVHLIFAIKHDGRHKA